MRRTWPTLRSMIVYSTWNAARRRRACRRARAARRAHGSSQIVLDVSRARSACTRNRRWRPESRRGSAVPRSPAPLIRRALRRVAARRIRRHSLLARAIAKRPGCPPRNPACGRTSARAPSRVEQARGCS
jgi:hypothetical protein